MIKKQLITLKLFCFVFSVFSQNYNSIVSEKEIYDFINENINKGEVKEKIINKDIKRWETNNDSIFITSSHYFKYSLDNLPQVFSQQDKEYIINQIYSSVDSIWHKAFENTVFNNQLNEFPLNTKIYSFSTPLFSINREYAIFYKSYYCGLLCGSGSVVIYKCLSNNVWEIYEILSLWNN